MLHRQTAILGMNATVRTKLLAYMENSQRAGRACCNKDSDINRPPSEYRGQITRHASTYGIKKVYSRKDSHRIRYQATIQVKALRMYAREQSTLDAAIEQQLILVQMKQALVEQGGGRPHF